MKCKQKWFIYWFKLQFVILKCALRLKKGRCIRLMGFIDARSVRGWLSQWSCSWRIYQMAKWTKFENSRFIKWCWNERDFLLGMCVQLQWCILYIFGLVYAGRQGQKASSAARAEPKQSNDIKPVFPSFLTNFAQTTFYTAFPIYMYELAIISSKHSASTRIKYWELEHKLSK